jgi:hypothetical protein
MSELSKPHQAHKEVRPTRYDGLTGAEISQLSQDYLQSPEIFEELKVFSGKYVDELETLNEMIDRQFDLLGEIALNKFAQTKLLDASKTVLPAGQYQSMFPETLEEWARRSHKAGIASSTSIPVVMPVALKAAGDVLHELHQEASSNGLILAGVCEGFADTLVSYCHEKIKDCKSITVMGRRYLLKSDPAPNYLETLTKDPGDKGKTLIFGNLEQVRNKVQFLEQAKKKLKPNERKPVKVGLAPLKDWKELLDGLQTMTKF